MKLNYWRQCWTLRENRCPCDIHFVEYCKDNGIRDKSIFHFGTGHHHHLGTENLKFDPPNEIFGVTASKPEYRAYIRRIIKTPAMANYYKVMFCDIYTLKPRSIPSFDLVTLFHLCEYYSESNDAYTSGNDATLLAMFLAKLNPGGQIFFYRGSNGYTQAQVLIDRLVEQGEMFKLTDHKSIIVYGKCPAPTDRPAHGERARPHFLGQHVAAE